MKALFLLATAALVTAVPASLGMIGNSEFSEAVPVRPPASATLLDGHGRPVAKAPASTPSAHPSGRSSRGPRRTSSPLRTGDDHSDDHGGHAHEPLEHASASSAPRSTALRPERHEDRPSGRKGGGSSGGSDGRSRTEGSDEAGGREGHQQDSPRHDDRHGGGGSRGGHGGSDDR